MRFFAVLAVLAFCGAVPASAIISLGKSNENFSLAGIGANSSGQGQSKMTWGSCFFDGTTTNCTLSGSYTGFGSGGTYKFVVSYPGNGAFPLIAVSQTSNPDQFFAQATSNYSFAITLTQNSGPVLNFYSFANFNFVFSTPTCTGVSASQCSVGPVGLTPNATITGPITGSFDPTPTIRTSQGVISAGGYGGFPSIAPASWVEIYGFNLATTRSQTWSGSDFAGSQAPSVLSGTTVTVAGKAAYVAYVSPEQVNVQVPSGIATGPQSVVVTTAGGTSLSYSVNVNATQGGLLAPPAFVLNGKQNVVAVFSNALTTFVLPTAISGITTARAKPGDAITLYGIGFGPVTPDIPAGQITQQQNQTQASVQIAFGGVPAKVTYAGLVPNLVGLYQFNVVVPQVPANDSTAVTFTVGTTSSTQTLYIAIGQ